MAQDKQKIQQVIKKAEKASKLIRCEGFIFSLLALKRISELTFSTYRRKGGRDTLHGYLLDIIVSNRPLAFGEIEMVTGGANLCVKIRNAISQFEARMNRYPTDKEIKTIHGEVLTDAEWSSLYGFEDFWIWELEHDCLKDLLCVEADAGFFNDGCRDDLNLPHVDWDFYKKHYTDTSSLEYAVVKEFLKSDFINQALSARDKSLDAWSDYYIPVDQFGELPYRETGLKPSYEAITVDIFREAVYLTGSNQKQIFDWKEFYGWFSNNKHDVNARKKSKLISFSPQVAVGEDGIQADGTVSQTLEIFNELAEKWLGCHKLFVTDASLLKIQPSPEKEQEVLDIFNSLDLSLKNFSTDDFDEILRLYLIRSESLGSIVKKTNQMAKPPNPQKKLEEKHKEISRIMVELLDPQLHESIWDPHCGIGTNLIEAVKYCKRKYDYLNVPADEASTNLRVYGEEEQLGLRGLAGIRLALLGQPIEFDFSGPRNDASRIDEHGAGFGGSKSIPRLLVPQFKSERAPDQNEHVVSPLSDYQEPFNLSICNTYNRGRSPSARLQVNKELYLLVASFASLHEEGRMAIAVTNEFLKINKRNHKIDQKSTLFSEFFDTDKLEAVIGLGKANHCILIINFAKPENKKKKVLFVEEYNSKTIESYRNFQPTSQKNEIIVSLGEIEFNNFDLLPSKYLGDSRQEVQSYLKNKTGVRLKDVCEIKKGKSAFRSKKVLCQFYDGDQTYILHGRKKREKERLIEVLENSFGTLPINLGLSDKTIKLGLSDKTNDDFNSPYGWRKPHVNYDFSNPEHEKIANSLDRQIGPLEDLWRREFGNKHNPFGNILRNGIRKFGGATIWVSDDYDFGFNLTNKRGTYYTKTTKKSKLIPLFYGELLSADITRPYLDHLSTHFFERDNIKDERGRGYRYYTRILQDETILVSLAPHTGLRPTIFDPAHGFQDGGTAKYPISINDDVVSITPKEHAKIDLEYLVYALRSDLVNNQIRDILKKKRALKSHDLAAIVIHLPQSIEEQRRLYKEQKKVQLELKNAQEDLIQIEQETIAKETSELHDTQLLEENSINHIIHTLSPKIYGITAAAKFILKRGDKGDLNFNKENLIKGDDTESIEAALQETVKGLQFAFKFLEERHKIFNQKINPEDFDLVDIKSLLNEAIDTYIPDKNLPSFNANPPAVPTSIPVIEVHKVFFIQVIHELMLNAQKYAFSVFPAKEMKAKKQINFSVSVVGSYVHIHYWNNGVPFDKTKKKFLSVGDPDMTSGGGKHGGNFINLFIKKHRGDFDIVKKTKYPLHFKFSLPIKQRFYQESSDSIKEYQANFAEEGVLSVSAAETNHLIKKYKIHACPGSYRYQKTKYISFRMPPEGEMQEIYKIEKIIKIPRRETIKMRNLSHSSYEEDWDWFYKTLGKWRFSDDERKRLMEYISQSPFLVMGTYLEVNALDQFYVLSHWKTIPEGFKPKSYSNRPMYHSIQEIMGNKNKGVKNDKQ
jgi:hypothetical protein